MPDLVQNDTCRLKARGLELREPFLLRFAMNTGILERKLVEMRQTVLKDAILRIIQCHIHYQILNYHVSMFVIVYLSLSLVLFFLY